MLRSLPILLDGLDGWTTTDPYSTAWVALVPHRVHMDEPAWPQALKALRKSQLEDGGWGTSSVYYAHDRTISTLAAIRALSAWGFEPGDDTRVAKGLNALQSYAHHLPQESHEPVGFEMLLPQLVKTLPQYEDSLPVDQWAYLEERNRQKLAMIDHMMPDPNEPRSWWFSLEMLPEEQIAKADDILEANGSIATSTAATAVYLRAHRLHGRDIPAAANYLENLLNLGQGSVPFSWPTEIFQRVWALDSLRRVGIDPGTPGVLAVARTIREAWEAGEPGISSSKAFRVNDGDDTLVGFGVLNWAGLPPSEEGLLAFWKDDHFLSYKDERHASVSANIHGLIALRTQPGFPHHDLAEKLSGWLIGQMRPDVLFDDKWHFSPYYSVAHAIGAFAGWHDPTASRCINFLEEQQNADGGWGMDNRSTIEETIHCVLGLYEAHQHNLLRDRTPLRKAARFFSERDGEMPRERLWIGKTLFRPDSAVRVMLLASYVALEQLGCAVEREPKQKTA